MQTNYLLSGAIEKLGDSFMAIHATASAQQRAAHKHDNLTDADIDYDAQLREQVDAAVTGLQFQDMTSQLIARALDHVSSLKASLEVLTAGNQALQRDDPMALTLLMDALQQHFVPDQGLPTSRLRKSVAQNTMNSGEIELF